MFDIGRTILRAYKDSDLDSVIAVWNEAETQPFTFTDDFTTPRSAKFVKSCLDVLTGNGTFFAIVEDKETGAFIGEISLSKAGARNRDGSLGIALKQEYRGKGIGSEITRWIVAYGFKEWGLHRVSLIVVGANDGAVSVYKRVGFTEEGRAREAIWWSGKWVDLVYMGILEREWDIEKGAKREQ